ncbi:hypothetical protein [Acinetobacter sp.]|uniref:hypothetical protein n=1 Tax=Acinetobacter sp. TaxID=472 RepID=UPI00388F4D67
MSQAYHYLNRQLNTLEITQSLLDVVQSHSLSSQTHVVILALRFAVDEVKNYDAALFQDYLQTIDADQIVALVKNIKIQLSLLECLKLQHEQDMLYVAYPKNHSNTLEVCLHSQDLDAVCLTLSAFGQAPWSVKNPEEHAIAGVEIVHSLQDENAANHKVMLQRVEDAIDLWVTAKDPNDEHFWEYFPAISVVSVSLAIYELFKRYQRQEMSWQQFQWMAAKISGLKVSKIALIGVLLSLPVVGQVTGAYLVARLLLSAKATWFEKDAVFYRYLKHKFKP